MTRNRLVMFAATAVVLLTAACARLYVEPANATRPGFRYYLPHPYLLVSQDTARIVWLPDMSKQYAVEPVPGLGTLNLDLTLENGWKLTQVTQDIDSKVPETIESVGKVLATLAPLVTALPGPAPVPAESVQKGGSSAVKPPQLYSLEYDSSGSMVIGMKLIPTGLTGKQ